MDYAFWSSSISHINRTIGKLVSPLSSGPVVKGDFTNHAFDPQRHVGCCWVRRFNMLRVDIDKTALEKLPEDKILGRLRALEGW